MALLTVGSVLGVEVRLSVNVSPLLNLTLAEIELLIGYLLQILEKEDPADRLRAHQFIFDWRPALTGLCRQVRHSRSAHSTDIYVSLAPAEARVTHAPEVLEKVTAGLGRLERVLPRNHRGLKALIRDIGWIIGRQIELTQYLCQSQRPFLASGEAKQLKPIHVRDVAEAFGFHPGTVSRLIRGIEIVPEEGGLCIQASWLMPGERGRRSRMLHEALDMLKTDTKYFRDGQWQITNRDLARVLHLRTGLLLSERRVSQIRFKRGESRPRRTASDHRRLLKKESRTCLVCGREFPPMSESQWAQAMATHQQGARHKKASNVQR